MKMDFIIKVIWFLLPSGVANIAPVFATKLFPNWNAPLVSVVNVRRLGYLIKLNESPI